MIEIHGIGRESIVFNDVILITVIQISIAITKSKSTIVVAKESAVPTKWFRIHFHGGMFRSV
jgi:hypothetical protein